MFSASMFLELMVTSGVPYKQERQLWPLNYELFCAEAQLKAAAEHLNNATDTAGLFVCFKYDIPKVNWKCVCVPINDKESSEVYRNQLQPQQNQICLPYYPSCTLHQKIEILKQHYGITPCWLRKKKQWSACSVRTWNSVIRCKVLIFLAIN